MKKLVILLCLSIATAAWAKTALPLKRIALFTSGVDYVQGDFLAQAGPDLNYDFES